MIARDEEDVGSESRFLPTSPAFNVTFGMEWCGYPKVKNFKDMFIRHKMYERDRWTDGRTDRHRMTA